MSSIRSVVESTVKVGLFWLKMSQKHKFCKIKDLRLQYQAIIPLPSAVDHAEREEKSTFGSYSHQHLEAHIGNGRKAG